MKHWTKKEDSILLKAVSDLPNELDKACEAASMLMENRTPAACRARWRRIKKSWKSEDTIALVAYSRKKKAKQLEIPFQEKLSLWQKIKKYLRKLFK